MYTQHITRRKYNFKSNHLGNIVKHLTVASFIITNRLITLSIRIGFRQKAPTGKYGGYRKYTWHIHISCCKYLLSGKIFAFNGDNEHSIATRRRSER